MKGLKKLAWVLLFFPQIAGAAESFPPLTWRDCVAIALEKNPDLMSARKNLASARAQYYGSFNGYSPQVVFSNSINDSDSHPVDSRWQAQAQASMNFFNASENAAIRQAAATLNQAEASYRVTSSNVRDSLRQAFANLLFDQESVRVGEKILEVRQANAKMVALMYDSGRESKGNMLREKAELKQAEVDLASAVRRLRASQQELNRQLGQDGFGVVSATGTLTAAALPELPDTAALVDTNPQVAAQKSAVEISYANLKSARSNLWPFISGQYSRSFSGPTEFPNESAQWNASAVISYRLFGNGITSTYYAASSAKRGYEKAGEDLRSTRNQVRSNLESSWANLASSIDQVQVQNQFLEAARQRNDEAQIGYTSGLTSFQDWELAVADFVNFERGVIQADLSAVVSESAWLKALGKSLEEER